jgi:hypothetical protein
MNSANAAETKTDPVDKMTSRPFGACPTSAVRLTLSFQGERHLGRTARVVVRTGQIAGPSGGGFWTSGTFGRTTGRAGRGERLAGDGLPLPQGAASARLDQAITPAARRFPAGRWRRRIPACRRSYCGGPILRAPGLASFPGVSVVGPAGFDGEELLEQPVAATPRPRISKKTVRKRAIKGLREARTVSVLGPVDHAVRDPRQVGQREERQVRLDLADRPVGERHVDLVTRVEAGRQPP